MGLDITRLGLRTFVSNPDLEVSLACHVAARLHDKPCGDIQLWLRPYGCRRGAYDEEGSDSMNSVSVDSIALAGKQLEFFCGERLLLLDVRAISPVAPTPCTNSSAGARKIFRCSI